MAEGELSVAGLPSECFGESVREREEEEMLLRGDGCSPGPSAHMIS